MCLSVFRYFCVKNEGRIVNITEKLSDMLGTLNCLPLRTISASELFKSLTVSKGRVWAEILENVSLVKGQHGIRLARLTLGFLPVATYHGQTGNNSHCT